MSECRSAIMALLLGALLLMEKRSKPRLIGSKTLPSAGPNEMNTSESVYELGGATEASELAAKEEIENNET